MTAKKKRRGFSTSSTIPAPQVPEVDLKDLESFAKGSENRSTSTVPEEKKRGAKRKPEEEKAKPRTYNLLPAEIKAIDQLIMKAASAGVMRKKGDVVRTGIFLLSEMSEGELVEALSMVRPLK